MQKFSIKHWAEEDQPRKKLLLNGAHSLSHSELLAILINNGTTSFSALEIAKNLLSATKNDLNRLGSLPVSEIKKMKIKGIGEAKAITIAAALELGVRRNMAESKKEHVLKSSDIATYLQATFQYRKYEVFAAVYLNRANRVLHMEVISQGGLTGTVADPRVILKKALEHNATAIILCHNHPSGNLRPSAADELITQKIKQAAALMDIQVIDHIIVSDEGYYSFADEGRI
jgi:DNA repair protein RadC